MHPGRVGNNSENAKIKKSKIRSFSTYYFFCFWFLVYRVYDMVLFMDISLVTELRNVEWEIFLIYREGLQGVRVGTLEALWPEVDRLDGLLADG